MVKYVSIEKGQFKLETGEAFLSPDIIWIDILNPTEEEKEQI